MQPRLKRKLQRNRFQGCLRLRTVPLDWTEADFKKFWPRLTERERERYTVERAHNLITTAGRAQMLQYIAGANTNVFCQQVAFGTAKINVPSPGDAAIGFEIFRSPPTTSVLNSGSIDISTFLNTGQANGVLTNVGIFGINATGVSASGTMMTHVKFNYNKTNLIQLTADYNIKLT